MCTWRTLRSSLTDGSRSRNAHHARNLWCLSPLSLLFSPLFSRIHSLCLSVLSVSLSLVCSLSLSRSLSHPSLCRSLSIRYSSIRGFAVLLMFKSIALGHASLSILADPLWPE